MAIEALAGAAVKEIGAEAAREAATKAGLELAQKMASELGAKSGGCDASLKMVSETGAQTTGGDIAKKMAADAGAKNGGTEFVQRMSLEGGHPNSGSELQTAMMERQAVDEGFRIGEMPEEKGEGRELLKQKESDVANELCNRLDAEEFRSEVTEAPEKPDRKEVLDPANPETTKSDAGQATAEAKESSKISELVDTREDVEAEKIKDTAHAYMENVKEISPCPETLEGKELNPEELKIQTSELIAKARDEFNKLKDWLIDQWEKQNGKDWPRYKEDVYYSNGTLLHKAGDRYDCHHIHPLNLGGKNEVSNITPLHCLDHFDKQGIHSAGSPYSNLQNLLKIKEVA